MASGALRRSVQLAFGIIPRKQNALHVTRINVRKISSSVTSLQKYFSEKHEWIDIPDGTSEGTVGITDYAQDKLGEVVYADLPEIGMAVEADGEVGVLESVKAASDVYSPISGEVTEVNSQLVENPKLINDSPYGEGWIYKMTVGDASELDALMNEEGYEEFLKTEA